MIYFPTLSYTSTGETPTLSYAWGLQKIPVSEDPPPVGHYRESPRGIDKLLVVWLSLVMSDPVNDSTKDNLFNLFNLLLWQKIVNMHCSFLKNTKGLDRPWPCFFLFSPNKGMPSYAHPTRKRRLQYLLSLRTVEIKSRLLFIWPYFCFSSLCLLLAPLNFRTIK